MPTPKPDDQSRLVPSVPSSRGFADVIAGLEVAAIDAVEEARRARGEHAAGLLAAQGGWLRRMFRRLGGG